jgi:hypothetical protein
MTIRSEWKTNKQTERDSMNTTTPNIMNSERNGVTKGLFYLVAVAFIAFLATGCTPINYKPAVSLGTSPQTIKANVKLETFIDQSPQDDKGSKAFGMSACEPGTLEGELAADVTDAVLTDFNNNQVFENVKKRFENEPDLVIKGTIHRFYGKFGPTPVMWITIPIYTIWLFGVPIMGDDGLVDLEISIERPDGTVLGTYRGQSKFSKGYNMYQNAALALPTRLNKAFSESIAQIREQILRDEGKLSRQR